MSRAALLAVLTGCALASGRAALAEEFTLRSEVDARRVGVEDQVQLTVTAEGSGAPDEVPLPTLTNLQVVGGPFLSTQVSIVNGRMSQSRVWTWVLQPKAVGKAEVGPASARSGSVERTTPAIALEVVAGSVTPRSARRPTDPFATSPFGEDPIESFFGRRRPRGEPKLFVEASLDRKSLHVGEPLQLTYSVYTQVSIADLKFVEAPQYPGFWVEDLERPRGSPAGEAVTRQGEQYSRFPILVKLLFPTRPGRLTIPAVKMRIGLSRQSFFDTGGEVVRSTRPVAVDVEPIPDAPGFSGAVGRFRTSAELDRERVALGEAATLRFKVEGTGNLKWIDRPPEVTVSGATVYPPQAKSDLRAGPDGIHGWRRWEFVVVPQTSGTLEIPALPFAYFDPSDGRLVRTETRPLTLRVEGGTASAQLPLPAAATARASGALPLRVELDQRRIAVPELGGGRLALLGGLVLLLHAGIWGGARALEWRRRRSGRQAPPRSVRAALRQLDRVGRDAMSKEMAAALIEKTLHEVFGSLDGDAGSESARAVGALLEDVHFVRYAPQLGDYTEKLRELAVRAGELVRRWA